MAKDKSVPKNYKNVKPERDSIENVVIIGLFINGVTVHKSVYDSPQFPSRRAKMKGKFLNRLQGKFILCTIDSL